MKSNINGRRGFGLLASPHVPSGPPRALVNMPPTKVMTTNNSAAITPPTISQVNVFPISCRPVRLLGSLNVFFSLPGLVICMGIVANWPIHKFCRSSMVYV